MPRPARRPRAKELQTAADHARIRQASRFNVVFFRGRDSAEDGGVVKRGSMYEVVPVQTLAEARELVRDRGRDSYGRTGLVRAICHPPGADPSSNDGAFGITVGEDFVE